MSLSLVDEYRSAKRARGVTQEGTEVRLAADRVIAELAERTVVYTIKCMLCGAHVDHHVTVDEAADYVDTPRGICGIC